MNCLLFQNKSLYYRLLWKTGFSLSLGKKFSPSQESCSSQNIEKFLNILRRILEFASSPAIGLAEGYFNRRLNQLKTFSSCSFKCYLEALISGNLSALLCKMFLLEGFDFSSDFYRA